MKDFERQCEETSALAEMLADDRWEVEVRLRVCRHRHGVYVARGRRVCRDCGEVISKEDVLRVIYGGFPCSM